MDEHLKAAADRLAELAMLHALRTGKSVTEVAFQLVDLYGIYRHEFSPSEQNQMKEVIGEALNILVERQ